MGRTRTDGRRKTLWVSQSAEDAVKKLAQKWGCTTAEAYRRLLKAGLEKHLKDLK